MGESSKGVDVRLERHPVLGARMERLLDLVENFVLFDDGREGGARKVVARNHQVLGVNNAVVAVQRQEQQDAEPVEEQG